MEFNPNHPKKGPFLKELQPGDHFMGFYVLRNKQLEPFREASRGYFLTLVLSDRSGQLIARVWEGAENVDAELIAGDIVKLDGEVETYLDRKQIRVLRTRPAKPGEYDLKDMLPSSPRDVDEMLTELQDFIEKIENPFLSDLVNYFYSDRQFLNLFQQAPAARKIHHAYLHGLLEHTLEVLCISQTVIKLYAKVNPDLLLSAVLLHDIGKVREFEWETDINYSTEGRLLGHIVLADEMINTAIRSLPDFPPDLALQLRHTLLSHHGRYEWGSPRRPKTLEAIALHHIENLSAQINRFTLLLDENRNEKGWSEYDRLLRRHLYSGDFGDDDLSIEESSWTK